MRKIKAIEYNPAHTSHGYKVRWVENASRVDPSRRFLAERVGAGQGGDALGEGEAVTTTRYLVRARDRGTRKWARVVVEGGKTSPDIDRAMAFEFKHEAAEAAMMMADMYPNIETKVMIRP